MSTGVAPVTPAKFALDMVKANSHGYFMRCLIALDVFCNVVFFKGRLDETMSSHAARSAVKGNKFAIVASKCLDFFGRNHGANAEVSDYARAEAIALTEEKAGEFPKGKE